MKKTIAILTVILLILSFSGCSKGKDQAEVLNDNARGMILPEFRSAHYTLGAFDDDGNPIEDPSYPDSRYFIVQSREEQDEIFTKDAGPEVDYSVKTLLVFTFTSITNRPVSVSGFRLESGHLTLELKLKEAEPGITDATAPYQRYVIVQLDKAEITDATVTVS